MENWEATTPEEKTDYFISALEELNQASVKEIVDWLERIFDNSTLPSLKNNSRTTSIHRLLEIRPDYFEVNKIGNKNYWSLIPQNTDSNWSEKYAILTSEGHVLDAVIRVRRESGMLCVHSISRGGMNPLTSRPYQDDFVVGIIRLLEIIRSKGWVVNRIAVAAPRSGMSLDERTIPVEFPLVIPPGNLTNFAQKIRRIAAPVAALTEQQQRPLHWYFPDSFLGIDIEEVARIISGRESTFVTEENPDKIAEINASSEEIGDFQPEEDRYSDEGWVYILENPAWEGWVKIGKNKKKRGSA
uniref:Uncharacterized protein n=1 Tax=uncultured marine group II/III euryarchaeote AD1000_16_A02 TaxID=1457730 RepID=A0A075FKJ2_9EURY|nr:hypothetical protein [uncultured marine group II/III euryarchaeote AD1000_16_A02]